MAYQHTERKSGGILGMLMAMGVMGLAGGGAAALLGFYAMSRAEIRIPLNAEPGSPEDMAQLLVVAVIAGLGFLLSAIATGVLWKKAQRED